MIHTFLNLLAFWLVLVVIIQCSSKRDVPIDDTKKEVIREAPKGRN